MYLISKKIYGNEVLYGKYIYFVKNLLNSLFVCYKEGNGNSFKLM